jgi:signal transduction histidine kinase
VFVAGTGETQALIRKVDILLAAVMLISAIVGVLFARSAANNISKPIRQTCEYASRIGSGDFTAVPTDVDTVEIRQLRESIDDMSNRLKAADQAQKQFLQNASHELRTPLMSIQGYAEAIETGIGFEPREAAAVIKSESRRLTVLVEELLTLSRMENYLFDIKAGILDMNELLTEYVYRLEGAAFREKKRILWQPAEGNIYVFADEQLMSQAVNNVVSNCLRYAASQVSLSLVFEGEEVILSISDDGPGIGEDELPHIFDRFYKGNKGAFGLGLAIAEKAVTLMGGSITAGNAEGGAVFRLRFKAKKENN